MKREKKLILYFTRGVSLSDWLDTGLLHREVALYNRYLQTKIFSKIIFVTYGVSDKKILLKLIDDDILHNDIDVIDMPKFFNSRIGWFLYSFISPLYLKRKLLNDHSDYVHKSNQLNGSWSALIARKIFGGLYINRTGFTKSFFQKKQGYNQLKVLCYQFIEKILAFYADVNIVASKHDAHYIENLTGVKPRINYNYISVERFFPQNKERLNRCLFVGRLSEQKNLFNLIKACDDVGLDLDLYGFGPQKEEISNYSSKLNISVELKGIVSNNELPEIYNKYRYFVLCSLYEGMPKVLIEAMASGCICVSTNVEGCNEVVIDGETGYLSDGISSKEIAETLARAKIECNKHPRIINRGVKFISENFTVDAHFKREYESIILK